MGAGAEDDGGTTIFVKGFDRSLGEDDVRAALQEAFGECGEVTQVRLPMDRETGELKGIGFIEFSTAEGKVGLVLSPGELGMICICYVCSHN